MLTLDKVKELVEKDSAPLDLSNLAVEAANVPYLHGRWMNIRAEARGLLAEAEGHYHTMLLRKWKVYTGKMSPEEAEQWKEDPFNLTVLRGDLDKFIDADPEMISVRKAMADFHGMVELADDMLNGINRRGYAIKSAIDFLKFSNGVA